MKKLLILIFLIFAFPVWATNYYVKTGGNDDLAGTSDETAWATIAKVTATATSGDTVYFRSQDTWTSNTIPVLAATAGVTYNGSTYGSGTRAKLITTTTATGSPDDGVVNIFVSNVTLSGFDVDADEKSAGGIYIGYGAGGDISGITVDNCVVHDIGGDEATPTEYYYGILVGQHLQHKVSNVTIQNTTVYNTGHEGISIYPSRGIVGDPPSGNWIDTVLVRNCIVHDTAHWGGTTWGHGIDVGLHTDNATIEFSTVYNTGGVAIVTYNDDPSPGSPDNTIIRYNLIYDNTEGIILGPGDGPGATGDTEIYGNILIDNRIHIGGGDYNTSTTKIYNNTIYMYSNDSYALFTNGITGTPTIEIKNNIFVVDNYDAIVKDNNGSDFTVITHAYNLYYRTSGAEGKYIQFSNTSNYTGSQIVGSFEATAQITSPAFTGNTLPTGFTGTYGTNMVPNTTYFQLASDSPAKDTGATLASYTGCINGAGLTTPITRPLGAAFDIGAYEYGTVAQSGGSAGSGFKIQGVTIR